MNSYSFKSNLFVAAITVVFGLGIWGFWIQSAQEGLAFDWLGAIYAILSFFVLETTGPNISNTPLALAKFFAAGMLGYGFFLLAYNHITYQYNVIRVKNSYKNHFVIIGLDNLGMNLAEDLVRLNKKIVVIEIDQSNKYINAIKKKGAIVFLGDSYSEQVLSIAGTFNAGHVVVSTGTDDLNMSTAIKIMSTESSERKLKESLKLLVHINDFFNNNVLKDYVDLNNESGKVDIDTFNSSQLGAQYVYDQFGPFSYLTQFNAQSKVSILIWGYNEIAMFFLLENIILSQAPFVKLKVIIADREVDKIIPNIKAQFPFIEDFLTIQPLPLGNDLFLFYPNEIEQVKMVFEDLKVAYLFDNKDAKLIEKAGYVRQFFHNVGGTLGKTPIVATLCEDSGIVPLLKDGTNKNSALSNFTEKLNVSYVNNSDMVGRSDKIIFESEIKDIIAKTVNFMYSLKYELAYQLSEIGLDWSKSNQRTLENFLFDLVLTTSEYIEEIDLKIYNKLHELCGLDKDIYNSNMSIEAKWFTLTDRKKDSNRYVARHLKLKVHFLFSMGYEEVNRETIEELFDLLAPVEHSRWMSEKLVFGYRYGSLQDVHLKKELKNILKIHDQLIPYSELTHEEQSKDMDMFFLIPLLYQIEQYHEKREVS